AVIALLFFIAGKLALNATNHIWHHGYSIDPNTSLAIVMGVLAIGIVASVLFPEREEEAKENA
ncbi:tellurium resistance protein TerC, partial [Pseudomonas aeruginosa]